MRPCYNIKDFCKGSWPADISRAREELIAKRKLTLILRSKAYEEPALHVDDMVQTYVKHDKEKRGKWLSPLVILSFDRESETVTVSGASGHKMRAAVEDCRAAVTNEEFARMVQKISDSLDTA